MSYSFSPTLIPHSFLDTPLAHIIWGWLLQIKMSIMYITKLIYIILLGIKYCITLTIFGYENPFSCTQLLSCFVIIIMINIQYLYLMIVFSYLCSRDIYELIRPWASDKLIIFELNSILILWFWVNSSIISKKK